MTEQSIFLTSDQQAVLDAWRRDPDAPGWTRAMVVTVTGPAGEADLEKAVARFIEGHDIFRLRIDPDGGAWAAPGTDRFADIEFLDFTDLPPEEQESELTWMILDEAEHGWDLCDAWPVRVNVAALAPDQRAVVFLFHRLVYHHGVRDRYAAAFADAFRQTGTPGADTVLPSTDADTPFRPSWFGHVRASGGSPVPGPAPEIGTAPVPGTAGNAGTDPAAPARKPSEAGTVTQDLAPLYPALASLARDLSLEIQDLLLAGVLVWHHLFARITASALETDVPAGPDDSAGPAAPEKIPLGPDIRRTRIPAAITDDTVPADLARHLNRLRPVPSGRTADSREVPGSGVQTASPAGAGVRFCWAGPDTAVHTSGPVRITRSDIGILTTEYDLELIFSSPDSGPVLTLVYDQRLMGFDAAASLAREIRSVLGAVTQTPGEPVAVLQQTLAGSRRAVPVPLPAPAQTQSRTQSRTPAPESTRIPAPGPATPEALFARTAARYPDHAAVVTADDRITYRDLDGRSGRLARAVFAAAGRGGRIGILMTQDIGAVIAILAVLRSGNTYVPLDVTAPPRRLEITAADADLSLVILDRDGEAVWRQAGPPALPVLTLHGLAGPGAPGSGASASGGSGESIDTGDTGESGAPGDPPPADPKDDACIIYTSGTTGRPKGVVQTRENVCHFAQTYAAYLGITPDDTLTLMSAYLFDAAVLDIFTALSAGARLVMFDLKKQDLAAVSRRLEQDRVTVFHSTASVFRYLMDSLDSGTRFPGIRYAVLGGEPGFREDLTRFKAHFDPPAMLVNLYGLSELTIGTMGFFRHDADVDTRQLPIGGPIAGVSVAILDDHGRPTPGQGQMVFSGNCLAREYRNLPDVTAQRFHTGPDGTRSFATGDIGEITESGTLIHLGRRDFQIKIRGYRVEPGEIESSIAAHDGVDKCVVHPVPGPDGEPVLTAFIVPASGATGLPAPDLARFLAPVLPGYMIPQHVITLPSFPRTPSGKIDRKALGNLARDAG